MPDNIFKGSYEGASSTGSGQQIHKKAVFFDADGTICDIEKGTPASRGDYKTGEEWPSGMAVYRKKQGVCA